MTLLNGCAIGHQHVPPSPIEPQGGLDAGTACDSRMVTARVNALFFAINHGDISAVDKMFPSSGSWSFALSSSGDTAHSAAGGIRVRPVTAVREQLAQAVSRGDAATVLQLFPAAGGWEFHLQPAEAVAHAGVLGPVDIDRVDPAGLDGAMALLSRFHFTFTAPVRGQSAVIDHVSPQGTVSVHEAGVTELAWQATGAPLLSRGKHLLRGSGNIRLYCENELFSWVGLGASGLE